MSQENVEIVRKAAASFARTREFGSLLAPDAVVVNAPGSPFTVKDAGPTARSGHGLEVNMELNVVYTLADGQITRIEGFLTRRDALEAAGLSE